jgi:protein gp37
MSKIEWTTDTWNPIAGCTKVSAGCTHCYAEIMANRLAAIERARNEQSFWAADGKEPSEKYQNVVNEQGRWNGKITFVEKALQEPLQRKKPTTYFVNSMSDLFHENVPDETIDRIFAVMALCPQHTFQVLTKRPDRMLAYMSRGDNEHGDFFERISDAAVDLTGSPCAAHVEDTTWPLPNVWVGVSVENQAAADARIPLLLQTPAAVRFLSIEPLLGPVDLQKYLYPLPTARDLRHDLPPDYSVKPKPLHWVIVGGESGPGARPMHPDWARSLRDQCQAAGVPFFFKQWGAHGATAINMTTGAPAFKMYTSKAHWQTKDWWVEKGHVCLSLDGKILKCGADFDECQYPVAIMRKVSKAKAGRRLDGRTWDEYPEVGHG